MLATPLAGALSDRTTHAYGFGPLRGRRHRWTLAMAFLGAISMLILAHQQTVAGVAVFWVLFSAFQNGEYASLSAAIPDHVPVRQRATVAGWVGMPQALGLVVGTVLVVLVLNSKVVSGYYIIAALFFLLVIPFVFLTPDHPLPAEHRESFSWRRLGQAYWISPKEYPDFAWAWITRFLASLAIAMGTLYLLYFLRDKIHYGKLFPGQSASDGLLILILIYTVCVVITAIVGGVISDRMGKRKMIVTVSGALMGVAALRPDVRRDLGILDGGRGAVRRRLRRLPRGRPGADHAGAARRRRPGQGSRHHQHRHRRTRSPRSGDGRRRW